MNFPALSANDAFYTGMGWTGPRRALFCPPGPGSPMNLAPPKMRAESPIYNYSQQIEHADTP
jgi:hypothetical protein